VAVVVTSDLHLQTKPAAVSLPFLQPWHAQAGYRPAMPVGPGDPQLYRHIVDTLVAEYGGNTSTVSVPSEKGRVYVAAWGLYAQIHRYARAALRLTDGDMAQEAHALVRIVLEYTVVLHWLVETGDLGVDTLVRRQAEQTRKFLQRASEASMRVPEDVVRECHDRAVFVSDAEAASTFQDICRRMAVLDLYAVYGMESAFVHPSLLVINTYGCEVDGGPALSVKPYVDIHRGNIPLLAHCLLWANWDLDDLTDDQRKRAGLEKLAAAVGVPPRLPDYTVRPTGAKRRGRRPRGKRRTP